MFGPLSEIACQTCTEVPYGMYNARSVVIEDVVYVGGGFTAEKDGVNNVVFKYIVKDDTWIILPPCTVTQFGLAAINGKPVTVGGRDILSGGKPTAVCFEFDPETDSWNRSASISDMPTARYGLDCASDRQTIVAVGGINEHGAPCDHVEIFSTDNRRWCAGYLLPKVQAKESRKFYTYIPAVRGSSMPEPWYTRNEPKLPELETSCCVIVDNHLFVKLSSTAVVHARISLISADQQDKHESDREAFNPNFSAPILGSSEAVPLGDKQWLAPSPSYGKLCPAQPVSTRVKKRSSVSSAQGSVLSQQSTPQHWKYLTSCPEAHSPLMNLRGCLACLGEDSNSSDERTLFVFLSSPKAWVPLFELPKGIYKYSCAAVLSNGNLLIVGGRDASSISNKVVCISVA